MFWGLFPKHNLDRLIMHYEDIPFPDQTYKTHNVFCQEKPHNVLSMTKTA